MKLVCGSVRFRSIFNPKLFTAIKDLGGRAERAPGARLARPWENEKGLPYHIHYINNLKIIFITNIKR